MSRLYQLYGTTNIRYRYNCYITTRLQTSSILLIQRVSLYQTGIMVNSEDRTLLFFKRIDTFLVFQKLRKTRQTVIQMAKGGCNWAIQLYL